MSILFNILLECFLNTRELILYRNFKGMAELSPWLQLSIIKPSTNYKNMILFLHKPAYPHPLLPSYIVKCNDKKLIIKGSMIYHHGKYPSEFTLIFKSINDTTSPFSYMAKLSIYGYHDIKLYVTKENNSINENIFIPFDCNSEYVKNDDVILYQPANKENTFGTFQGWSSSSIIKLNIREFTHYVNSDSCLVVFLRNPEERYLDDNK